MMNIAKLIEWVEGGKQLGNVFSFEINKKTIWSSVGIQKCNGIYKVYVDEIEEESMASEEYLREEIQKFDNVYDAIKFIDKNTRTDSLELHPCKGQRVFNPNVE